MSAPKGALHYKKLNKLYTIIIDYKKLLDKSIYFRQNDDLKITKFFTGG